MTMNGRARAGALVLAVSGLGGCAFAPAGDAPTLIRRSEAAMGSAGLKTLTLTGQGKGGSYGQAYAPGMPWPGVHYIALSRSLNFETGGYREEFGRSRTEAQGGGALPPLGQGEARGVNLGGDGYAWSLAGTATPPAPAARQQRTHDLWTSTPQGAIKAAARQAARAGTRNVGLRSYNTLSFDVPGQYKATLVLDDAGLVSRIESTLPDAVLGDVAVVTEFSDYRKRAGLMFPSRIVQSMGGHRVLDLTVTAVKADEPVEITVPESVRLAPENVSVENVADGVWFLGGGSHNSVAIELASQIVLVESPLYEGRALAVIAAANQLAPGKKVLTVINTHHHFDHAGGLRAAAAEGAMIFSSTVAKPYFETAFAQPATILPDRLAQSGRKPQIIGVPGKTVLADAARPVEIHELRDSLHAQGFLMVWLPKQKLLIEADAYTPAPAGTPPPAVPDPNHLNLVQNLERLGIAPERILPLHGRVVPAADLYAQIGRQP